MFKIKLNSMSPFFIGRMNLLGISDCFMLSPRQVGNISENKNKLLYSYRGIKW